jgi:hypothetical protein
MRTALQGSPVPVRQMTEPAPASISNNIPLPLPKKRRNVRYVITILVQNVKQDMPISLSKTVACD